MAIFADRTDAGEHLARELTRFAASDAVVLGIPRGGVVVAAAIARALGLPLGVAVVRKLGAPSNEEFAIGAIAEGVRVVDADAVRAGRVTAEQLAFIEDLERVELDRRTHAFGGTSPAVEGREVIVVDDGVATGSTLLAACHAVRARGARRIVAAVPVAPADFRPDRVVDEFVCPYRERSFWAVGQFYDDFAQTSDEEVGRLLSPDLP